MVSPHFPPDTSAGAHRVRLLAPHLAGFGWEPTVVTVEPEAYEGRLDPDLAALVPDSLRVVRAHAWSPRWTRPLGFGDLGLRAWLGLYRTCVRELTAGTFDALFITIYPVYAALLGPIMKRRFGVPVVLDYQDPWVGAWGLTVGGGPGGAPDRRSRLSRRLGLLLEPWAVAAADGITAVSELTYERVFERLPRRAEVVTAALPLGFEPADMARALDRPWRNRWFDPDDGHVHLCYVGTLLPAGMETLAAFFAAVAGLRAAAPGSYARLRLHFFGTSNQTARGVVERVMPAARAAGVDDRVDEHPARLDYLDALSVLDAAGAVLLLGSTERHYTASKLYPALLARRPLLALFHEESSVTSILRRFADERSVHVVGYDDRRGPSSTVDAVQWSLAELVASGGRQRVELNLERVADVSARAIAGRLAGVLDRVSSRSRGVVPV